MFCRKCGTTLPDKARFCTKCGTPVTASEGSAATKTAPKRRPKESNEGEKKRFNKTMLIAAIVLIVGAGSILGLMSLIKDNGGSSGKPSKSDSAKDEGSKAKAADSVYKPKDGEQRFLDILKEIDETKVITITQGESEIVTFGQDLSKGVWVGFGQAFMNKGGTLDGSNVRYFASHMEFVKSNDSPDGTDPGAFYYMRWIDPTNKVYSYYQDFSSIYESYGADCCDLAQIPYVLAPSNWEYVSADNVNIGGSEYYCETYTVNTVLHTSDDIAYDTKTASDGSELHDYHYTEGSGTPVTYSMNIAFDADGNMKYIGETNYDSTPSDRYNDPYDKNKPAPKSVESLMDMFADPIDRALRYSPTNFISIVMQLKYDQYTPMCISPTFDASKYDLSTYTEIPDPYDYYDKMSEPVREAIEEEFAIFR